MCWRCSVVSLRSLSLVLLAPGDTTVTQASRAPGRMPRERATAWRSEYSVASVTSAWGTATMRMGVSSICCEGRGLGV